MLHEDKIKKNRLAEHTKFVQDNSKRIAAEKKLLNIEVRTTKKLLTEGKDELGRKLSDLEVAKREYVEISEKFKFLDEEAEKMKSRQKLIDVAKSKILLLEKNLSLALKVKVFYRCLKSVKKSSLRFGMNILKGDVTVKQAKAKTVFGNLMLALRAKQLSSLQILSSCLAKSKFKESLAIDFYGVELENLKIKKLSWLKLRKQFSARMQVKYSKKVVLNRMVLSQQAKQVHVFDKLKSIFGLRWRA